jgi:hypothetical protein
MKSKQEEIVKNNPFLSLLGGMGLGMGMGGMGMGGF